MQVAAYCRRSVDKSDAAVSVAVQEKACRTYAARTWPDLPVVVYTDNDLSAANPHLTRPAYEQMIEDIRAGRVAHVVTREQNRLTRQVEQWEALCRTLHVAGIPEIHLTLGGTVSVTEGSRLPGRLISMIDAEHVEVLRVKTRATLADNAEAGRPHGRAGYGYRRIVLDGRPAWEPDPPTAVVVQRMVKRIAEGRSLGAVADDLTDRGVPTPRGAKRWNADTVRSIVTAPRIVGLRVHHGSTIPAAWAPIVDRVTWERAKARLASNRPGFTRDQRRRYLLTGGLAVCAECGSALISGTSKAAGGIRVPSYLCPHPTRPEAGCGRCSILAERLEDEVVRIVGEWLDDPVVVDVLNERHTVEVPPVDELAEVEAKLVDIAEQYARGDLLEVEHAAARRVLVDRHRALSASVTALAGRPDPITAATLVDAWRGGRTELRRAVLDEIVEQVEVTRADRGGRRLPAADRVIVRFR